MMPTRSYEEVKETLTRLDKRTLEERVSRLTKLGTYTINVAKNPVPNLMGEYEKEASNSYINGNYRNCIFSCSSTADQVFRHEIIQTNQEFTSNLDRIQKMSFGDIIKEAKKMKIKKLQPLLSNAWWLNDARNKIAVHPLCLIDSRLDEKIANQRIARFIKEVLKLVNIETQETILATRIKYSDQEPITMEEILENPSSERASEFLMWSPHHEILEPVAFEAYQRMVNILISLYPAKE